MKKEIPQTSWNVFLLIISLTTILELITVLLGLFLTLKGSLFDLSFQHPNTTSLTLFWFYLTVLPGHLISSLIKCIVSLKIFEHIKNLEKYSKLENDEKDDFNWLLYYIHRKIICRFLIIWDWIVITLILSFAFSSYLTSLNRAGIVFSISSICFMGLNAFLPYLVI